MFFINKCFIFKYLRYLYDFKCLILWVCYIMYILCIGVYEKKKRGKKGLLFGRNKYICNFNIFLKD